MHTPHKAAANNASGAIIGAVRPLERRSRVGYVFVGSDITGAA